MGKNTRKLKRFQVQRKDVFQRLNFLLQAAHLALTSTPPQKALARHYTQTMKTLAHKNVVRLSPHVKRTLCKKCAIVLIPGITSVVRIKRKVKKKILITHCLECKAMKSLPAEADYILWHDKEENIAEIIELR